MKFYDKLIFLINEKGISKRHFSQEIGITAGTLTRWDKRGSMPRSETIVRIAKYFGVTIHSLTDDSRDIEYLKNVRSEKAHPGENQSGDIPEEADPDDPAECPFCGKGTVLAKIATTYYFLSEHLMRKGGVDMDGETMGQIIGDMPHLPTMKYAGFCCTSCGKKWDKSKYAPVKNESGLIHFEKQEGKVKRGRKNNV